MVALIKRDVAWTKLYDLLNSEGTGLTKVLAEFVMPCVDFIKVMERSEIILEAVTTSGVATEFPVEVPVGERWDLYIVEVYKDGGTFTIDQTTIFDPTASRQLDIDEYTATTKHLTRLESPLTLEAGWKIGGHIAAHTGAGNFRVTAYVKKIDLRK